LILVVSVVGAQPAQADDTTPLNRHLPAGASTLDLGRSHADAVVLLEHLVTVDRLAVDPDQVILGLATRKPLVEQSLAGSALGDLDMVCEAAAIVVDKRIFIQEPPGQREMAKGLIHALRGTGNDGIESWRDVLDGSQRALGPTGLGYIAGWCGAPESGTANRRWKLAPRRRPAEVHSSAPDSTTRALSTLPSSGSSQPVARAPAQSGGQTIVHAPYL